MAQRSDSRAAAKVKRSPKKAKASAAPKRAARPAGTSKPASPSRSASKTERASKTDSTLKTKSLPAAKSPSKTKSLSKTKSKTSSVPETAKRARKQPTAAAPPQPAKAKSRALKATAKAKPAPRQKPQSRPVETAKRTKAAPPPTAHVAAKAKPSRKDKTPADTTAAPSTKRPTKAQQAPAYLATELGQPADHRGEPISAGSARAKSDTELQDYTLQLWRQMQSGRVVNRYTRAIERAGFTTDEVWTAGIAEKRPTSSTSDDMRRYRQKLLFRANLLEAILSETVADLHRLDGIEPTPAETARESG